MKKKILVDKEFYSSQISVKIFYVFEQDTNVPGILINLWWYHMICFRESGKIKSFQCTGTGLSGNKMAELEDN